MSEISGIYCWMSIGLGPCTAVGWRRMSRHADEFIQRGHAENAKAKSTV